MWSCSFYEMTDSESYDKDIFNTVNNNDLECDKYLRTPFTKRWKYDRNVVKYPC